MAVEKPPLPPLQQEAGAAIDELLQHFGRSLNIPRVLLGVVVSTAVGPPATLTATVRGESVPNIRYIGSAPTAGKVAVILTDGPFYVCLGTLT
jgi:hypothetical protein